MGDIRIEELDAQITQGEFILVCGKTGSGKTTLLGKIKKQLGNTVAYVMQNPESQVVNSSVARELYMAAEDELRAAETASYFGISKWMNREVDTLSGGEKQLLNLASAIAMGAQVVLLDEPLAMLDPIMRRRMTQIITNINKELLITVIIVEHTVDELFELADRIIYVDNMKATLMEKEEAVKVIDKRLLPVYTQVAQEAFSMKAAKKLIDERGLIVCDEDRRPVENEIALNMKKVSFAYGKHEQRVLEEASLSVRKGSITAIVGENGSGKTTLCNLLMGYIKPYSGKIEMGKSTVGMLCQDVTCHFIEDEYDGVSPYDLSAGERQLLALKLVMANKPDILILDEPTKGLDGIEKELLTEKLRGLAKNGVTIIIISHDMDVVAELCEQVYMLSCGHILDGGNVVKFLSENMFYTSRAAVLMKDVAPNVVSRSQMMKLLENN